MPGLGTVVVAGRAYWITGLELAGGQLRVTATGPGPNPPLVAEPATVFGGDGIGIGRGWRVSIPETGRAAQVTIVLPLQIVTASGSYGDGPGEPGGG